MYFICVQLVNRDGYVLLKQLRVVGVYNFTFNFDRKSYPVVSVRVVVHWIESLLMD